MNGLIPGTGNALLQQLAAPCESARLQLSGDCFKGWCLLFRKNTLPYTAVDFCGKRNFLSFFWFGRSMDLCMHPFIYLGRADKLETHFVQTPWDELSIEF
jgi:hypothetical protein